MTPINRCDGSRSALFPDCGYSIGQFFEGVTPGDFFKISAAPGPAPFHGAGVSNVFIVQELQSTRTQRANAPGIDRVVCAALDLYRPFIHFSYPDTAAAGTEETDRVFLGELPFSRDRDPGPVLGPNGDIVRDLPG